jgi:hypothetical protein
MEVDLDAIPWIADSLQTLWIDSLGNPASDGRATCAFDYDMIVDANGNVHMANVIGTTGGGFAISSGLAKFMADIWTPDGGATWEVTYLSPVLTFRGILWRLVLHRSPLTTSAKSHAMMRESDFTSHGSIQTPQSFTGSMNGIGFGESDNLAPNLRMVARDLTTGMQTYPQLVSRWRPPLGRSSAKSNAIADCGRKWKHP